MYAKATVIVPVYNMQDSVRRCVQSLLGQTLRDVEVLAVDDGSADQSLALCQRLARDDARLRVFSLPHGGVSAAKNRALDELRGEFVTFVDADDWLEPDALQTAVDALERERADVFFCNTLNERNGRASLRAAHPAEGVADTRALLRSALCSLDLKGRPDGYYLCITNKVFRVSSLQGTPGGLKRFDPSARVLEDGLWLMGHLPWLNKGVLCAKGYYHRTLHEGSVMNDPARRWETARDYLTSYAKLLTGLRAAGQTEAAGWAAESVYGTLFNAMREDSASGGERIAQLWALLPPEDQSAFGLRQMKRWMAVQDETFYRLGEKLSPALGWLYEAARRLRHAGKGRAK